jgi:hypothetical protein
MSILHPFIWLANKIGDLFKKLITDTADAYNDLPKEERQQVQSGVIVSQILKENYQKGKDYVTALVGEKLNLSNEAAQQLIMAALNEAGINVSTLDEGFNQLAEKAQNAVTSTAWNNLWQLLAKSVATILSGGKLDWVSLSLGLIEIAYQDLFGKK